jgi:DtxR family Mn-dependent transcriptional regulator
LSQRTTEEYLEAIYALEERGEQPVKTTQLANYLELAAASVSEMLARLAERKLVDYTPYEGVSLTPDGQCRVLELTRQHRLWEVFLYQFLGIGLAEVYQEACTLEHATSGLVSEKLAQFLGNPHQCPHGNPIPDNTDEFPELRGVSLSSMEKGQRARVVRISHTNNTSWLNYLCEINLLPGTLIEVTDRAPLDSTIIIKIGDDIKSLGPKYSAFIFVEVI